MNKERGQEIANAMNFIFQTMMDSDINITIVDEDGIPRLAIEDLRTGKKYVVVKEKLKAKAQ